MIPRDLDPRIVRILQRINEHLRELSQGAKATSEGSVASGGSANLGSTLTQVGTPTGGGTVQTASASLASPTYAIAGGLSFTDTADVTKRVLFNAASLTTGTTRTLTVPDLSGTLVLSTSVDPFPGYLLLAGRTGGQTIGSLSHPGGTTTSLAIDGPVVISNIAQSYGTSWFTVAADFANNAAFVNLAPSLTALNGAASGTLSGVKMNVSGTPGYTSGSYTIRLMNFSLVVGVASSTTLTELTAGFFQSRVSSSGGTIGTLYGLRTNVSGTGLASTGTAFVGLDIQISNRNTTLTSLSAINIANETGGFSKPITTFRLLDGGNMGSTPCGNDADIVNWTGLYLPAVTLPTGTILGLDIAVLGNRVAGLRVGTAAFGGHLLELDAGTTARAPILLTSGTSLTSPVAGAIEFTTDDFFATITTGPARKAFVLDDGTRLTATRVPFATTNGRLTDHANLVFAAGTGLTLAETLLLTGGSATVAPLKISAGTILTTPVSGVVENDGIDFLVTDATGDRNRLAPRLLARRTAINLATANTGWQVYVVPTGRTLVVTGVIVRLTAFTASGANFRVDGTAAPGDISPAVAEAFTANGQYMSLAITNPATVQPATTAISFYVAATTATATATVELFGYLY